MKIKLSTFIKILGFISINIFLKLYCFSQDNINSGFSAVEEPVKRVLIEEGTGTWCGWCVKGIVYMDSLKEKYPDTWIGVAVHSLDSMTDEKYSGYFGANIARAIPSGAIDRKDLNPGDIGGGLKVEDFEEAFLESLKETPPANIYIDSIQYDEVSRKLKFAVRAVFIDKVSNYRLNAIIVEDNVTGTGEGWSQTNYYAGNSNGKMGGFELLSDPVPAEDMSYHNVARAILGGWEGEAGSLPIHVKANETHSHNFSVEIKNSWDINNIKIIGLLINRTTGIVKNVNFKPVFKETSKINNIANKEFEIYPNPSYNGFNIKGVKKGVLNIIDMNGRVVLEKQLGENIDFVGFDLKPGIYFVHVKSKERLLSKKIIVLNY